MVFFNYALRKLNAKIVYYGPGLCGKTTNLQWIHDHFEGGQKGKMISLATEGDRTIFFDLLPLEIGTIRGMDVTLQLYTVPGQVHYNSTRQLVLRGADGVVFVADSQRTMQGSNRDAFKNLEENLRLQGLEIASFPHVLQFNKRDLRDLLSLEDLDADLNAHGMPFFEAVATDGVGVQETLEGIVKLVMRNLRERYEQAGAAAATSRGVSAAPSARLRSPAPGPVAPPRAPVPPSPAVAPPRPSSAPVAPPRAPSAPVAPPRPPAAQPGAAVRPPQPAGPIQPPAPARPAPPPWSTRVHPPEARIEDEIQTADFGASASPSQWPPPPEEAFEDAPTGVQDALQEVESAELRLDDVEFGEPELVTDEPTLSRSTQAFEPPSVAELIEPPPRETASPFEPEIDEAFASAPTETGLEIDGLDEIRIDQDGESFEGPSIGDFPLGELRESAPGDDPLDDLEADASEPEPGRAPAATGVPAFEPAPPPPTAYVDEIRAPSPFVRRAEASADIPMAEPSPFDLPAFSDEPSGATEFLGGAGAGSPSEGVRGEGGEPTTEHWDDSAAMEPVEWPAPSADVAPEPLDWTEPEPERPAEPEEWTEEEPEPLAESADSGSPLGDAPDESAAEPLGDAFASADVAPPWPAPSVPEERPPAPAPPVEPPPAETPPEEPAAPAPPPPVLRPRPPAPAVDDLVASVLGDRVRPGVPRPPAAVGLPPPVASVEPPRPGGPVGEQVKAAAETATSVELPKTAAPHDRHAEPVMMGEGDPFADEPEPVIVQPVAVIPARPGAAQPPPLAAHVQANQLQVRLQGTGAIAESGEVRELDIQVPVPGSWVGNRRVTLQLRLTLMPAPEEENGGNGGPA